MTTEPEPEPGPDRTPLARTALLGVLGFGATLLLLLGMANLIRQGNTGFVPASPAAVAAASSSVTPSASPSPEGSAGATGVPVASNPTPSASGGDRSLAPGASPSEIPDAVLVGAGDIADCALDDDSKTAALVASVAGTVFTAGDNVYQNGSAAQFRDCYDPTWGAFRDRTRPAAGNHDWETKDLAGYLGYFGEAAAPHGVSWYSYELGAWHIIVLDSDCANVGGCGATSPQGEWLAADLGASRATCTLAIWHHPRFSSGFHGNDKGVAPFWQALYAAGADVVINGHDHDYERFAPQDPDGKRDTARGLREFVVGTGGAALRPFAAGAANSQLRLATSHGIIRLDLRRASFDWTFLPTDGSVTDSGRAPCH